MNKKIAIVLCVILLAFATVGLTACLTDDDVETTLPNEISGANLTGENVKWYGRTEYVQNSKVVNCYYTATGFTVRFIGTKLQVTFNATNTDSAKNRPYFIAGIDEQATENGKRFAITESTQTVTVAENLDENKVHTVTVLKASEPENSLTSVSKIVTDGEFFKPSKSSSLKFQILGGSGISGHGCLGGPNEDWTTANSSSLSGFGYLTAQAFGAECQFVSNSGMGLKWGYRGVDNLIEAYEAVGLVAEYNADGSTKAVTATQSKWDHSSWTPDVVIINIGGNDWNSHINVYGENTTERKQAETEFKQSVKTLLDRIHNLYPSAYVAWTCNSETTGNGALAKSVIADLAYNSQITVIEINNAKDGADNHASAETQKLNAELVINRLQSLGIK
ncbi:MAG: hypothetical protein K2M64_03965 [Clostridia bacterium]|nr:hypothetical protein [Clostridia bacterium]